MSETVSHEELSTLVGLLCDNRISDEEFSRLEALLEQHPEARRLYHVLVATHVHIEQLDVDAFAESFEEFADKREFAPSIFQPKTTWRRRLRSQIKTATEYVRRKPVVSSLTALAFVGLMIVGLALLPASREQMPVAQPQQAAKYVAQMTNLLDAVWAKESEATLPETLLFAGDMLNLRSGLVEVRHRSGAVIVLEGPARYSVESEQAGRLLLGRLAAKVPPSAVGFTVSTPTATIVDLGTEFGLAVDETGGTETHVFTGVVELRPHEELNAKTRPMKLRAGSAVQVRAGARGNIEDIQSQPERFVRQLPRRAVDKSLANLGLLQYRSYVRAQPRADMSATVGTLFEVNQQPLLLTHLGAQDVDCVDDAVDPDGIDNLTGFADDDGFFRSPISVGLWDAETGDLLAKVEVKSTDPRFGSWRYAKLPGEPVMLQPNRQYVLGAFVGGGIEWFLDAGGNQSSEIPFAGNPRVRLLENRYVPQNFALPARQGGGTIGRWGAANGLFQEVSAEKTPETAGAKEP